MAYSIEEEDKMMAMFESIASQPIEAQRPYNEVRNPKPMMESAVFEGTKVDFSSWTADSKKVGKAKTASNPDLSKGNKSVKGVPEAAKGTAVETKGTDKPVTENDTVTDKKEDKQITKLVSDDASHEAKGEPKAKSGKFDSAAKSAASAQRSKADSNKKFSEESKKQRKIDMFRDFVKSLGVDAESKEAAEKVLKKFDQISKHIGEPGDGKVKPKMESSTYTEGIFGTIKNKLSGNDGTAEDACQDCRVNTAQSPRMNKKQDQDENVKIYAYKLEELLRALEGEVGYLVPGVHQLGIKLTHDPSVWCAGTYSVVIPLNGGKTRSGKDRNEIINEFRNKANARGLTTSVRKVDDNSAKFTIGWSTDFMDAMYQNNVPLELDE